jgi:hypothetical protein
MTSLPNSYYTEDDMRARWKTDYLDGSCQDATRGGGATINLDLGYKTMIFHYDNNGTPAGNDYYSEARFEYNSTGVDWTASGAPAEPPRILSISYLGSAENSADPNYDRMYAMIQDAAGNRGQVVYNPDANAQKQTTWEDWLIKLSDLNSPDVNLRSVRYLIIGFGQRCNSLFSGNPGGEGQVSFDNIRLEQPICIPQYGPIADFTDDCVVDLADVKVMSQEWLTAGVKADIFIDGNVDFKDFAVLAQQWMTEQLWPPE